MGKEYHVLQTLSVSTLRIYCRAMSLNLYQRHRGFGPIMNNTYYDDHGDTIYTVHTPFSLSLHRTTTISKAIHDTAGGGGSREASTFALARRITVADEPMGGSLIDTNSFLHTSDDEHAVSLPGLGLVLAHSQRLQVVQPAKLQREAPNMKRHTARKCIAYSSSEGSNVVPESTFEDAKTVQDWDDYNPTTTYSECDVLKRVANQCWAASLFPPGSPSSRMNRISIFRAVSGTFRGQSAVMGLIHRK
ncbi:hypothetical protein LENED_004713 [Lentinula edodes]|uniref:Uncharacterized protein n=1 Tax=Lentinula edodes TaxID=5353 RepID=A0A1Q3E715_LENED|nr:hypothetical protein LENED_004713 [Lentinula edodes]